MVAPENVVVGACVVTALPVAYGAEMLTGSYPVALASMFAVGIVLPSLLTRLLVE
jgi:hypothetical protein